MRNLALLAAACTCLAACMPPANLRCAAGLVRSSDDTLFFGTDKAGGVITAEQWDDFLKNSVTPRFPQGLTVWPAVGQWRGEDQSTLRESSYVLRLVHPDTAQTEQAVRELIDIYKRQFQQDAVLRISSKSCISY